MKEIIGKIELLRSESNDCICCEGEHVYGIRFILAPYERKYADKRSPNINDWLEESFPLKKLEGRQIRVTAEIVEPAHE